MKPATSTVWAPSWATMSRSRPTGKESFPSRAAHECSIYDQGLQKVRRDGRLGLRSLQQGRHAWQRCFDENLLPLPREGFSRLCLHAIRALMNWVRATDSLLVRRRYRMTRIAFLLVAVVTAAGIV